MPEFSLEMAIPVTNSRTYREVIRRAKRTGRFNDQESILAFTRLIDLFTAWDDFTFILWTAQKWTGFFMTICGKPLMPYTNDYFYILQDLRNCIRIRETAEEGEKYCFHQCWGCRKLNSINRYIGEQNYHAEPWYKYGTFIDQTKWKINKTDIWNTLQNEAEIKLLKHCPYWSEQRIGETISRLPERFYIDENFDIIYRVDYDSKGNACYLPATIHHKGQFEGYVKLVTEIKPPEMPDSDDIGEVDKYLDRLLKRRKTGE